jgi:hypothetical protein
VLYPADVVWRDAESSCCILDQELNGAVGKTARTPLPHQAMKIL